MLNVAINGLGRIGRATLKIVLDKPALRLTAVNDVLAADNLAYLLKFDTSMEDGQGMSAYTTGV